jgi:dTDP-4-amino-4,6-dideoxygalactose transaminase
VTKETEPADRHQPEERISFNRPSLVGNELAYVRDAIERGHISGDGSYTRRCEEILSQLMAGARVLLTTSCTHALEMAALLLDIRPGDEVIVPSFTFVSAANAFVLRGARPLFIDSRPDTLNMDERLLAGMITERTRAVVAMHYGGVGCEMDTIMAIARNAGVKVVEDNAHGLFGEYGGRPLGTFGDMSTLSFHETKNIFCGEGGALVLNDPSLAARAEILREKGTDRSRFFRGEVDKYTWVDVGSSYVPSEMLAAFLLGQLEKRDDVQAARQRIWDRYHAGLAEWAEGRGVQLPEVPPHCASSHHIFYLLMPSLEERQALMAHLRHLGIQGIFHYIPLHTSAMGQQFGGRPGDCPVAESVSDRIVRLPFFSSLTEEQQMRVIDAVRSL